MDGLRPGVHYTVKCTASFNGIQSCESVSNSLGMKDIFVYAQCIMYISMMYRDAPDLDYYQRDRIYKGSLPNASAITFVQYTVQYVILIL